MTKRFIRRSLLYAPASSPKMMEKAAKTLADSVIIDLEDAVSLGEKEGARGSVSEFIPAIRASGKEVIVRINSVDCMFGLKDIMAISALSPDALVVPKATVESIHTADTILSLMESEFSLEPGDIGLIPLLETADGILQAAAIVKASSRINGVQLGAEDLTKELGVGRTAEGQELYFPRQMLIYAACAAGIDCLDTPFTDVQDLKGLAKDAGNAAAMGFTGKTCIHPLHLETINRSFSPSLEEVARSQRLVDAYEAAVREDRGACLFEGKMVDQPIADRALKLLARAKAIQVQEEIYIPL